MIWRKGDNIHANHFTLLGINFKKNHFLYNCRICQIVFFNTKQGVKQFFKRMKRRYSFDDLPVILIKNMLAKRFNIISWIFLIQYIFERVIMPIAHPPANFWEFRERGEDYRNFCRFVPLENAQSRSIWQNVLSELFSVVGFGLLEGAYLVWSFCVCVCGSALRARGSERKHKSAPRRRHPICQEEKTTKWCAREEKNLPRHPVHIFHARRRAESKMRARCELQSQASSPQ